MHQQRGILFDYHTWTPRTSVRAQSQNQIHLFTLIAGERDRDRERERERETGRHTHTRYVYTALQQDSSGQAGTPALQPRGGGGAISARKLPAATEAPVGGSVKSLQFGVLSCFYRHFM